MSLTGHVARGLKWQAMMIVGRQLLSLVVFTALARLLGPADFGLMGLTFLYLTLVGFVADQGIGAAIIQRANLEREHLDTGFWYSLGCAGILCVGTIALAHPVAVLLGEPRLVPLLRWSSLSLVFSSGAWIQNALFSREMDFRRPAIRTLAAQLGGGAVGLGMALADYGVWALIGQQLATALLGTVLVALMSTYRPRWRFSLPHLRDLLGVSAPLFVNWVVAFFSSRLDQLVIGRIAGVPALGIYVIAGKIPDLAKGTALQAISDVSVPALSKLQHDHARLRQAVYAGMGLNATVMFAVFGGGAAVASDLIPLLFGNKWASASTLCSLLCVYSLIQALQVFNYPALLASRIRGSYLALSVGNAVGTLVACLIGIQFGTTELAIGLIANSLVMIVPSLMLLRHQIGVKALDYGRPCVAPAGAALLMVGVIQVVTLALPGEVPPWLRLTCHVAAGAAAYLGFLQLVSPGRIKELLQFATQATKGGSLAGSSPPF